MSYKASAPGSLMLLGEYAVLHGKPALIFAVDKRITVQVTPRLDQHIKITSTQYESFDTNIKNITLTKPYDFVLAVLQKYHLKLQYGCDIHIESEFSDNIGFGSSAAVTVASIAAITTWLNHPMTAHEMIVDARSVIRRIQGMGSGADAAASVIGGLVSYHPKPLMAEKINASFPLTAIYAGFKTKTSQAVASVANRFSEKTDLLRAIMQSISQCVLAGILHAKRQEWQQLGDVMTIQQGLMEALGVSLPVLKECITALQSDANIYGAKISGAGLGDCVIGLGKHEKASDIMSIENKQPFIVTMAKQGVWCEKY